MKKKVVVSTCAVALAGTLAVGGVLAYLHAQTDTVRNVFTGEQDNLNGHIEEEFEKDKADRYAGCKQKTNRNNQSRNKEYTYTKDMG